MDSRENRSFQRRTGGRIAMLAFALTASFSFVAAATRYIPQVELLSADRSLITIASWAGLVVVASRPSLATTGLMR